MIKKPNTELSLAASFGFNSEDSSDGEPEEDEPIIADEKAEEKPLYLTTRFKTVEEIPEKRSKQKETTSKISDPFVFTRKAKEWHCFSCDFTLSCPEEIKPHRFSCENAKRDFPGNEFFFKLTGNDQYLICMGCYAICCKSQFPAFKKHIIEEQGGMSGENWCPLEYPREKPQQDEVAVAVPEDSASFEEQKGLFSCQLCHQRNFSRDHHLRRHYMQEHQFCGLELNVIQKITLLQNRNAVNSTNEKRYVCSLPDCLHVFSQSWRHQEHRKNRTVVRTLADVSVILGKQLKPLSGHPKETGNDDMIRGPINFDSSLREFKEQKLHEFKQNEGSLFTQENITTKLPRIRECLVLSKGFKDMSKIAVWVHSYESIARPVKTAKAKQNLMSDLQKFAEFLLVKYGRKQQVVEFDILLQEIRDRKNLLNKSAKGRKHLYNYAEGNSLPTMKELSALRENVTHYLETELEEQNIDAVQFRKIQHNIRALLCMRTSARAGTILKMRASYLREIEADEANGLYRIALMPPEIQDIRTGKGHNRRINLIYRQVLESHKNFRFDGEKYLTIKKTDLKILEKYLNLRSLFQLDSSDWLFAPLDSSLTEITKEAVVSRMKSYSRTVRKQHNVPNFDANRFRKAVNSHWAETVDDPRAIRALDQQMGHSRAVAMQH